MLTCSIKVHKVELIVGSVMKNWCPEHKQETLLSWKHACVTIGTQYGASLFFCDLLRHSWRVSNLFNAVDPTGFWDFHLELLDEWPLRVTFWDLFRLFCNAFLSRLLMHAVNSGLSSGICGGVTAVSWRVNVVWCWIVDSSGNLLLVAHTEALCTSRMGEGRRISSLVPWDLERPMKISTQKIQFTIPWPVGVGCWKMQICCCTAWRKEYIVQLHQSRLLLNSRDKGLITYWITTDKLVGSNCLDEQTSWQCAEWRTEIELCGRHLIVSV